MRPIIVIVTIIFLLTISHAYIINGEYFQYRTPCHINTTTTENLSNFPAYCILDTAALITAGKMNSSCFDIRITSGPNIQPPEIESPTCNTTSTVIWFRLPSTSGIAGDTAYVYYGNPTAPNAQNTSDVWSNNFTSVWNGGNLIDSLNVNNMSVVSGTVTYTANSTKCKLGGCFSFDTTTAFLRKTSATHPIGVENRTVSMWGWKTTNLTASEHAFDIGTQAINTGEGIYESTGAINYAKYARVGNTLYTTSPNQTKYYFGYMINSSIAGSGFFNNLPEVSFSPTGGSAITAGVINIGGTSYNWGNGGIATLDEVRLSNVTRDGNWLLAEYAQTYVTLAEETSSYVIPVISSPSNITYGTYLINITTACIGDSNQYLMNITANGINIITNQTINNATNYSYLQNFSSNGGWNITTRCVDGPISNTTSTYFTQNLTIQSILNYPPNNLTIYSTNTVIFNLTCLTSFSNYNASIFLDGTTNISNLQIANDTSILQQINNIPYGAHNWSVLCINGTMNSTSTSNFTLSNITPTPTPSGGVTLIKSGVSTLNHGFIYLLFISICIYIFITQATI